MANLSKKTVTCQFLSMYTPIYSSDHRVLQSSSTMLKLIVFLVTVSAVWGLPRSDKPSSKKFVGGRIAGGEDADNADCPYALALYWHGYLTCGATLIGSKWAVTAAHCTYRSLGYDLYVIAGSANLMGHTIYVEAVYEHPQLNNFHRDYDISILELEEDDFTISKTAPIALHDAGYTAEEGADVTIAGWGVLEEGGQRSGVLQAVVTKIVSHEICNEAYGGNVTDRMICAGNVEEGGEGACFGDDGGPVVVDGKLYAVVSWGYLANGCARPGYPGVHSKVTEVSVREFVRNITGL